MFWATFWSTSQKSPLRINDDFREVGQKVAQNIELYTYYHVTYLFISHVIRWWEIVYLFARNAYYTYYAFFLHKSKFFWKWKLALDLKYCPDSNVNSSPHRYALGTTKSMRVFGINSIVYLMVGIVVQHQCSQPSKF